MYYNIILLVFYIFGEIEGGLKEQSSAHNFTLFYGSYCICFTSYASYFDLQSYNLVAMLDYSLLFLVLAILILESILH